VTCTIACPGSFHRTAQACKRSPQSRRASISWCSSRLRRRETTGTSSARPRGHAATFIVFLLRRAIGDALKGLAARTTKLSVGVVAVELAESTARSWGGAALDEIRDATLTPVGDSSSALVTSLSDPTPADYAVIDLGNGDAWLTSRLFAVATIVARLRGLCAVAFTVPDALGPRLLGTATVEALRRELGSRYPWLDLANAEAWLPSFNGMTARQIERQRPPLFQLRPPTIRMPPDGCAENSTAVPPAGSPLGSGSGGTAAGCSGSLGGGAARREERVPQGATHRPGRRSYDSAGQPARERTADSWRTAEDREQLQATINI
jgi:hypothetical protein